MPKYRGVSHLNAVKALERVGFWVGRQGKHIVMTDETRSATVARHDSVNAITMEHIIRDAVLNPDGPKELS
jgi:hypothetical protein